MRTDLQLIQSAIAEYNSFTYNLKEDFDGEFIRYYNVHLPDKFKGLPSIWFFGILPSHNNTEQHENKKSILTEARKLINHSVQTSQFPLVLLSDIQNVNFNSEFSHYANPVFFLDKNDLPGRDFAARDVRETPILLAVKHKVGPDEAPLALSPYSPNSPVNDWRFFGRKNEMRELVDSIGNYFIIGARRIGKTSLLQEVKIRLEERGYAVYLIQVQNLETIGQVVEEIAANLSYRDLYQARQSAKQIDANFLTIVLKRLRANKKKLVLILDEIGNVLSKSKTDDWNFMGTLREISQNMDLRVFASAFQEIFVKQYNEFGGPFINFGNTLYVNVFTRSEVDELLVQPLNLWGEIGDRQQVLNLIFDHFGSYPLVLQFLGTILFKRIFTNKGKKIEIILRDIIDGDDLKLMENAVNEIYSRNNSIIERLVFLKLCMNIDENHQKLIKADINQLEIKKILEEIAVVSTLDQRASLLERLSMRGLLHRNENKFNIYHIASPIVWHFLNRFDSIDEYYQNLLIEVQEQKLESL